MLGIGSSEKGSPRTPQKNEVPKSAAGNAPGTVKIVKNRDVWGKGWTSGVYVFSKGGANGPFSAGNRVRKCPSGNVGVWKGDNLGKGPEKKRKEP